MLFVRLNERHMKPGDLGYCVSEPIRKATIIPVKRIHYAYPDYIELIGGRKIYLTTDEFETLYIKLGMTDAKFVNV